MNNNVEAFFALVRAGLWENNVRLSQFGQFDFNQVYRLAEEQSVVGIVASGLEHIIDIKVPQQVALQFAGFVLQLEQRNISMNLFIGSLVEEMRNRDIYTLLVKGQGIAQCYEKPLIRSCGDVDFFFSEGNYAKAKDYLLSIADSSAPEGKYKKHIEMMINPWVVELHGTMRCGLSSKIDKVIDEVQNEVFYEGSVRSWMNGDTQVFLPSVNCDIIFVFTHILQHFFQGGIGLRQICDWCRLLWTNRDCINVSLLEKRLQRMGLKDEWMAFGAFAVCYLGLPPESMPLYSNDNKWSKRANAILDLVFESGNFGQARDTSYKQRYSKVVGKIMSFFVYMRYGIKQFRLFPINAIKGRMNVFKAGFNSTFKIQKES